SWSDGKTVFGLYTVDKAWNSSITWDTQTGLPSTFIDSRRVSSQMDQYMNFDVTSTVNDWIQGIQKNNGFVVKSMPESNNT
ncbi:DNRLRE domain-containing protein, partial [Pseudomonas sp. FW305-BF6]|uniref:DNRLRE domain-containing protein n=1 Tax=Pseudomonas sp. FW305-BF6 TaxID=2070673 RepID=UPI0011AFB78A